MHNPHDRLFKKAFRQLDNARDELRAILPPGITGRLDFERSEVLPTGFVDETLEELFSDLLYTIPLDGEPAYVWTLLEHQSSNDSLMAYRLLRYIVRAWGALLDDEPKRKRLPPIIPVVVQHAVEGWTVSKRFSACYELSDDALAPIRAHLPDFEFIVDDLGGATEEALARRTESPYLRLVFWSLRLRGAAPTEERFPAWLEAFRALRTHSDRTALESILRYHMEVSGERGSPVIDAVVEADPGIKEAYVSLYDRILEEGLTKGRKEGLTKGRMEGLTKGRMEGEVTVLLKQLTHKFGEPSSVIQERLSNATTEQLERWAKRILTAITVEEVFESDNGASEPH